MDQHMIEMLARPGRRLPRALRLARGQHVAHRAYGHGPSRAGRRQQSQQFEGELAPPKGKSFDHQHMGADPGEQIEASRPAAGAPSVVDVLTALVEQPGETAVGGAQAGQLDQRSAARIEMIDSCAAARQGHIEAVFGAGLGQGGGARGYLKLVDAQSGEQTYRRRVDFADIASLADLNRDFSLIMSIMEEWAAEQRR